MFDFGAWLTSIAPTVTFLVALNIAVVQGLGKWVNGQAQTIIAGVTGFLLGFGGGIASFGFPTDFMGWFLNVILGLVVFGVSVGTYEAVKHASGSK
jgi:hypothetical protein